MFSAIRSFFDRNILGGVDERDDAAREHAMSLATAALLVEMTRADYEVQESERAAVLGAIQKAFKLNEGETHELIRLAEEEVKNSTSLYEFTGLINRHFTAAQKAQVVELLWEVAYADERLDKYEDYLVRKIADLIHVSHSVFIRTKHKVRESRGL